MRLATIRSGAGSHAAVVDSAGEKLVALTDYADVGALLRDADRGLQAACSAADSGAGDTFDPADLLAPVLVPGAIVCVGLNYRNHIQEMGRELPTEPTLFSKLARALTDPYAEIELPSHSQKVDYEAELAVVIGKAGRDISAGSALEHVAGLTILNDVSMRDFQNRTLQWFAGKTWQRSTPIGPWVVPLDELGEIGAREISLTVNGEERQRSALDDLVFDVPTLVADLSKIVELAPGDVIVTGTPGGVGVASERFLAAGDVVEVSIDGIGSIRNTFRAG